jgi:hypothetical protein
VTFNTTSGGLVGSVGGGIELERPVIPCRIVEDDVLEELDRFAHRLRTREAASSQLATAR